MGCLFGYVHDGCVCVYGDCSLGLCSFVFLSYRPGMSDVDPELFLCALGDKKGIGQPRRQTVRFLLGGGHGVVNRDSRAALV